MAMRTVAKEEINRWCLSNERGIWPELRTVSSPVAPQETVEVWLRESQMLPSTGQRQRRPWYQRQPRRWFRPFFSALLFVRERRAVFAFIAIFALIFGLAWWLTSLLSV